MTVEYHFSLSELAQILSALENERRNPNTKRNAIKAIERNATQIGISAEDVFDAADGLLSGRISAAEWRAQLRGEDSGSAVPNTERGADVTSSDEPAAAENMPTLQGTAEPSNNGTVEQTPKARHGTKQAMMIELLRRPEGATVEQIAEVTQWRNHTIRGAIAGALKKKLGLTITTERVRMVGPNKEGARGSYTIYRVVG
ncbi:MAG: DUF3489 domain-containing protein [Rhodospirillales bacterium]|nr:DUF3489 domain-containing protein [Rhodospirillales bacterium]